MGKLIKFPSSDDNESKKNLAEKKENVKSLSPKQSFLDSIIKGVKDYILYNFAVKNILDIDIRYKKNDKKEIGVIGVVAYEHKRRAGIFMADFIGKGFVDREGKVVIDLLAFKAGEPEIYNSLTKIMKAKKILPEIEEFE